MKKNVKVRVLCLVVASVLLSGAVATAAVLGSPYETLKRAVLDALTTRNVTEEASIATYVNGVQLEITKTHTISGDGASLSYNFDEDGNTTGYNYSSNGLTINPFFYVTNDAQGNEIQWFSADIYPVYDSYRPWSNGLAMFDPDERDSANMRFIELVADALIGDLKNNVTMTSENGMRHISGTLTESQVPEIAKAGIDVVVEQSGRFYYGETVDISFDGSEYVFEQINLERSTKTVLTWKQKVRAMTMEESLAWEDGTFHMVVDSDYWDTIYIGGKMYIVLGMRELIDDYTTAATRSDYTSNGNPLSLPMKSLVINYVHGEAEVDKDGNLLSIEATATATSTDIFGEVSVIDVKANARFCDFGTSKPVCPIPGAEQILTAENLKGLFDSTYMHVFFTLNDDGSINADSITTMHPRELAYITDNEG